MDQILPMLYLGDVGDTDSPEDLVGITAILCVAKELEPFVPPAAYADRKRQIIPLNDGEAIPPGQLARALKILGGWLDSGETVLVHCSAGVSRSPSIVTAYLMEKNHWMWDEAFAYVNERRPMTFPHPALRLSVKQHFHEFPFSEDWAT